MFSIGFVMKLKPGCAEEYKRRHDELWPELDELMKRNSVNMVIYRHGELLFGFSTCPSKAEWDNCGKNPLTPKWDKYMAEVMEADEQGNLYFEELPASFMYGQFK